MKRQKPIKRYNTRRRQRLYKQQYGEKAAWIREKPCCVCGMRVPSDPHHAKSRGAGGDKRHLVPLCRACHNEVHQKGVREFELAWQVSLLEVAEGLEEEWRQYGAWEHIEA